MTWKNGAGRATGDEPHLVFALPKPRYVGGVRLTYVHSNKENRPPLFQMFWKRSGQKGFTEDQHYLNYALDTGPQGYNVTVWIGDIIDQFRVHPDNKECDFRISKMVLLVPVADQNISSRR